MQGLTQISRPLGLVMLLFTAVLQGAGDLSHASAAKFPHPDRLSSATWWLDKIKAQTEVRHGRQYQGCLFGDSISAALGHSLGRQVANFGQGGLSSVSLLTQLKVVKAAHIRCQQVVVAVGTNDAWYSIQDGTFVKNMRQAIALTQSLGTERVILVPAFYSTLTASKNPSVAGPIARVDQINRLMRYVASVEQVRMVTTGLSTLFQNHSLRSDLTFDGVHLNDAGKAIYRQVLTQLFTLPNPNAGVNSSLSQEL